MPLRRLPAQVIGARPFDASIKHRSCRRLEKAAELFPSRSAVSTLQSDATLRQAPMPLGPVHLKPFPFGPLPFGPMPSRTIAQRRSIHKDWLTKKVREAGRYRSAKTLPPIERTTRTDRTAENFLHRPQIPFPDRSDWSDGLERTVANLNIEYFRQKLETEKDETKRRTLVQLLSEEQAKLAALIEKSADKIDVRPLVFGRAISLQS